MYTRKTTMTRLINRLIERTVSLVSVRHAPPMGPMQTMLTNPLGQAGIRPLPPLKATHMADPHARRRATRRSKELTAGLVAAWVSLVGLVIYAGSAQAAKGTVELTGKGHKWQVEYDNPQVTSVGFKDGILTVNATWTSLDAAKINFVQTAADAPANAFGLRLMNAVVNVTNNGPKAWKGFTLALTESQAVATSQLKQGDVPRLGADHPAAAHFHNDGQDFAPFDLIGQVEQGGDAVSIIELGGEGKTLANEGGKASWPGIGIHQFEKKGDKRNFTLELTPDPVADKKNENKCSTLKMTNWSGVALSAGQAFPTSIVLDVPDGAQLDNVNMTVQLSATSESTLAALSLDAEQRGDIPLSWTSGPEGWVGTASLGSISSTLTAIPAFTIGTVPSDDSVTITAHVDYTCDGLPESTDISSTVEILPGEAVVTAESSLLP